MYSKARPISKISIYFRLCFELAFLIGVPVQEKTNSLLTCYVTVILVKKLNVKLKSSCSQDKVTSVVVIKVIVLKMRQKQRQICISFARPFAASPRINL